MAKSQIAFDTATNTPTTFSVDHKGVLAWHEIIEDRESDAIARNQARQAAQKPAAVLAPSQAQS